MTPVNPRTGVDDGKPPGAGTVDLQHIADEVGKMAIECAHASEFELEAALLAAAQIAERLIAERARAPASS